MVVTCKLGEHGCWSDGKCRATSNCENKIVTNADRIRTMSDHELARFLDNVHWSAFESNRDYKKLQYPLDTIGWKEWLKQPAEE